MLLSPPEPLGEQDGVLDDRTVEQAIELVGVDAVELFDLPVQAGCSRSDLHMAYALVDQVPSEAEPSSPPLPLWTRSTWNGSTVSTRSVNWIAVFWS